MSGVSHSLDRFAVVFDDESLVADAGLLAAGALMGRLGVGPLWTPRCAWGAASVRRRGAKILDVGGGDAGGRYPYRSRGSPARGATAGVLGFRPAAASTVGSFLRSFTWGHVRQLDKAAGEVLGRAWAAGGGPGNSAMTIDVDSTVCEVFGETKAGRRLRSHQPVGLSPPRGRPRRERRDPRQPLA